MNLRIAALAAIAVPFLGTAALAADLIVDAPVAVEEAGAFDWEGLYFGGHVGGMWALDGDYGYGLVGLQAGYNFLAAESFLLGLEVSAEWLDGTHGRFDHYFVSARAGALVTDSVLVYGTASVGTEVNKFDETYGLYYVGAGVEFAVADQFSVFGQFVGGGYTEGNHDFFQETKATVGVNFHF